MADPPHKSEEPDRRTFVYRASTTFMFGTLALLMRNVALVFDRYLRERAASGNPGLETTFSRTL